MDKQKRKAEVAETIDSDEMRMEAVASMELAQPNLRMLCIVGEINTATVGMFALPFLQLDDEKGPITIKICSAGGDVSAGMAIYDLISSSKNKIVTEGFGIVQSVAACIFQAGDTRRLYENCRFMAHSAKAMIPYPMAPKELQIENQELMGLNVTIGDILKGRSRLKIADIERIMSQDVYYSAKECLKLGLCDEVIRNRKR